MEAKHIVLAMKELNKARSSVEDMRATLINADLATFAGKWASFLSALVRVFLKLKHGSQAGPAKGWFDKITHQSRTDPLLKYLLHARNADEHGGEEITSTLEPAIIGIGFSVSKSGFYPGLMQGSARIGLKPVVDRGMRYDPPKEHLGQPLQKKSILHVAELATAYYASMIKEAEEFAKLNDSSRAP